MHLDGRPVSACSQLGVWADGREVRTVEGLAAADRLDPLQEAFIAGDAPQCGFCTPGQLMSARALLDANPRPTRDEVRAALAGNLCRRAEKVPAEKVPAEKVPGTLWRANDATLVTHNTGEFSRVKRLKLVDWEESIPA